MSRLNITDAEIPSLEGKTAIVSGGASGIGYATVKILASKGAKVYMLDLKPPAEEDGPVAGSVEFVECNVAQWPALLAAFERADHVDIAVANAGVSEETDYFADKRAANGTLVEPKYGVIEINLRGVLNFVKLAMSAMRKQAGGGSIVITSSATAYAPEHSLPVYSSVKLALVGLVRALRAITPLHNISINAVAPAATITNLLPAHLAAPIMAAGLPVSTAHFVGLAVAYSATAGQNHRVEPYGKDVDDEELQGPWNGRTILTLGDEYTELEEPIARLRKEWFGEQNTKMTRLQQTATDFRSAELPN